MSSMYPTKGIHATLAAADSVAKLEAGHVYDRVELAATAKLRMAAYIDAALAALDQPDFDASDTCKTWVLTLANEDS